MRVSVVISTYNRGRQLMRTLDSVARQTLPAGEWELVVVDNNCTDGTQELFAGFAAAHPGLNARIVRETQQGLSNARNRGIAESKGEIIAMIDDDEEVNQEFAEAYIAFFDSHPEVSAAGGKIVASYEAGRPEWMTKYTEMPVAGPLDMGPAARPFRRNRYPGGGNMAFRRGVFERCGGFDPRLGRCGENLMGAEEKEFFGRLAAAGETIWYVPDAVIYHLIPAAKATSLYFKKVTRGCGASARAQALSVSKWAYLKALGLEKCKWFATLLLALWYLVVQQPLKAHYLVVMRRNITAGLLKGK